MTFCDGDENIPNSSLKKSNLIRKGNGINPRLVCHGLCSANRHPSAEICLTFSFCQRNPKPCPLLEVLEPGEFSTKFLSLNADIRTDIPLYNIYRKGKLEAQVKDIKSLWRRDFVTFLLGCSFSFEEAMLRAKIPVRHIEEDKNVPMFITRISCKPAGVFYGPMVVTMRPIPSEKIAQVVQITSRYASVHGAPIHIGDPSAIGIKNLRRPDFGDPVTIKKGEVPVFWACGVTPQAVVMKARPDLCITHTPGHMFISDLLNEELAIL
jgi:uncharacterized protein YcsI (UPF0317 family)